MQTKTKQLYNSFQTTLKYHSSISTLKNDTEYNALHYSLYQNSEKFKLLNLAVKVNLSQTLHRHPMWAKVDSNCLGDTGAKLLIPFLLPGTTLLSLWSHTIFPPWHLLCLPHLPHWTLQLSSMSWRQAACYERCPVKSRYAVVMECCEELGSAVRCGAVHPGSLTCSPALIFR